MKQDYLKKYLDLRLVIAFLGEKNQFNWWDTAFYSAASNSFLSPVFTKTIPLVQYESVKEAARRVHDAYIGVGNVFHLFRLQEDLEQEFHQYLLNNVNAIMNSYTRDTALNALRNYSSGQKELVEGPITLGNTNSILKDETIKKLAGIYLGAFTSNIKTYPYFMD